jgi:hypothetical protein
LKFSGGLSDGIVHNVTNKMWIWKWRQRKKELGYIPWFIAIWR